MKRTATTTAIAKIAIAIATTWMLAACSKTEPTGQPAAIAPATPASALDTKAKDDLARIRELMEKEEARKVDQEAKTKLLQQQLLKSATAPVNTFGR